MSTLQHTHLHTQVFHFLIAGAQDLTQVFCAGIEIFQIIPCLLADKAGGNKVLLCFLGILRELVQPIHPNGNLNALQFLFQGQIFLSLFRLDAQRLYLQFQLGDLVADAQQVIFGIGQLSLCFFLAVAVFGDTGSFLKDLTAISTFSGQNFVNTALADIGVTFTA